MLSIWFAPACHKLERPAKKSQLKTFIHGIEVFNRKIIMRQDSVIF